ncbi:MAG: hypothetical protein H0T89_10030 [Deltaproteobacteria bacterium]|nr:hypothetical protein [Deltaproteobacteria bacterium]MDQ3296049.1 hypothetical protein [Myxococcota bacterium]
MLDGLFVTPAVTAIIEALGTANADGRIAVIGDAKLATALGASRDVIPVALSARAAKKLPNAVPSIDALAATIEPASLAGIVATDVTTDDAWLATLRSYASLVRDGGALIFVDKGHAPEASRRALCAGLTELEQRHAGRTVVTSGLVTHLGTVSTNSTIGAQAPVSTAPEGDGLH